MVVPSRDVLESLTMPVRSNEPASYHDRPLAMPGHLIKQGGHALTLMVRGMATRMTYQLFLVRHHVYALPATQKNTTETQPRRGRDHQPAMVLQRSL